MTHNNNTNDTNNANTENRADSGEGNKYVTTHEGDDDLITPCDTFNGYPSTNPITYYFVWDGYGNVIKRLTNPNKAEEISRFGFKVTAVTTHNPSENIVSLRDWNAVFER